MRKFVFAWRGQLLSVAQGFLSSGMAQKGDGDGDKERTERAGESRQEERRREREESSNE